MFTISVLVKAPFPKIDKRVILHEHDQKEARHTDAGLKLEAHLFILVMRQTDNFMNALCNTEVMAVAIAVIQNAPSTNI